MNFFWCVLVVATTWLDLSAGRIVQNYISLGRISALYKKHPTKIIPTLVARKNWHEKQGGSKNLKRAVAIDAFLKVGSTRLSDTPACTKLVEEFEMAVGGAQKYAFITHEDCKNALSSVNKKICCADGFALAKRPCHSAHEKKFEYQGVDLKALGWGDFRKPLKLFIDDVVTQCPPCMSKIISKK